MAASKLGKAQKLGEAAKSPSLSNVIIAIVSLIGLVAALALAVVFLLIIIVVVAGGSSTHANPPAATPGSTPSTSTPAGDPF